MWFKVWKKLSVFQNSTHVSWAWNLLWIIALVKDSASHTSSLQPSLSQLHLNSSRWETVLAATCNLTDETLLLCLQLEIFKLRLRAQFQLNIELSVTATAHWKSTSPNWLDGTLCVFKFLPRSVFSSQLETGGTAWCLFYDLCGFYRDATPRWTHSWAKIKPFDLLTSLLCGSMKVWYWYRSFREDRTDIGESFCL